MKRNDKGRKRDTDDIEFIEIDLDEGFTNSSYEYFANKKELIDEEDYEEEDEEDSGDDDSSAREADSPEGDSAQKESAEKEPVNVSESEEAEEDPSAGDFEDNDEKKARKRRTGEKRGESLPERQRLYLSSAFLFCLEAGILEVYIILKTTFSFIQR